MSEADPSRRLLVAIASYGEKNLPFLERCIRAYRALDWETRIVVLSNIPKDLGPGIEVVVGLPSANPWSLPFGHKSVFAEHADEFDLFIYAEDDIEFRNHNLEAFLRLTEELPPDEIAGFQLYEQDADGGKFLPGVHGVFRWRPGSVRWRGRYLVAEFTNEHSACYAITRDQLKRAIASGGYLQGPREGRYDMLCTASTEPYTNCGMTKVLAVSHLDDFLLHHLPDRYVGKMGLSLEKFARQTGTLRRIADGHHPATELCEVESRAPRLRWSKSLYEATNPRLLGLVPEGTRELLSIGCGWGDAEAEIMESGVRVTALPLDSVIGQIAAERGCEVVFASLEDGMEQLKDRRFDCIWISNLLHLFDEPEDVLRSLAGMLRSGGKLLLMGPNFECLSTSLRHLARPASPGQPGPSHEGNVRPFGIQTLKRWLETSGLELTDVYWEGSAHSGPLSGSVASRSSIRRAADRAWRTLKDLGISPPPDAATPQPIPGGLRRCVGRFVADSWVVQARPAGAELAGVVAPAT
ncbi:MAG: class I SAM-dependent methyltransferase [Akkermansiaceae bacterium]|nr:class I SAM-dependent methyltransferase [Akkermansiaceae bacterium]NNM29988.1 class I SAM-dependent methyltransferase [Akkermansiaceae bacterium]